MGVVVDDSRVVVDQVCGVPGEPLTAVAVFITATRVRAEPLSAFDLPAEVVEVILCFGHSL
ncbi:hypothetical protein BFL43_20365 [Williamsia sp. 1135]|nr:hypothetical protein BFL43_20365 [Williamsia sp. 1135]